MKLIVGLILLVAIIAPGFAQRRCFTCAACQQPFERNSDLLQTCSVPTTPGDPTTTPQGPGDTTLGNTTVSTTEAPTTTTAPITGDQTIPTVTFTPASSHSLYKRDIAPFAETLRCYRVRRTVGDVTVYSRGCVPLFNNIEQTCELFGVTAENCKICNEDECNGATQIITSLGTILAALLIVLKLY